MEGIGASFIPKTFDGSLADEIIAVTDRDAFDMVKKLAATEGVLAGSSAGANVFCASGSHKRLGPGKRVATIIPDSAERYLSKDIFHFDEKKDRFNAQRARRRDSIGRMPTNVSCPEACDRTYRASKSAAFYGILRLLTIRQALVKCSCNYSVHW